MLVIATRQITHTSLSSIPLHYLSVFKGKFELEQKHVSQSKLYCISLLLQNLTKIFGDEHVVGRKEYKWALTMCSAFQLIINLCKIMRDSKHLAIIQTIHTNFISWVCFMAQVKFCQQERILCVQICTNP